MFFLGFQTDRDEQERCYTPQYREADLVVLRKNMIHCIDTGITDQQHSMIKLGTRQEYKE